MPFSPCKTGVSGHSPTPSAGDFEALVDSGLPSRISHQSASKYWRMLKTKGHQVAAKFLRYWYTFTENFLVFFTLLHLTILPSFHFHSSRSSEGFTPCPSGWRVLSRRCIRHLRKDQGMTGVTPMLTPHSQQISCRYIVYTYIFHWDVFQNWNRSKMRLCCTIDIDLNKHLIYSKISVPKQKLPTSWRLSSKRMCLSFNLSKAAIDSCI